MMLREKYESPHASCSESSSCKIAGIEVVRIDSHGFERINSYPRVFDAFRGTSRFRVQAMADRRVSRNGITRVQKAATSSYRSRRSAFVLESAAEIW